MKTCLKVLLLLLVGSFFIVNIAEASAQSSPEIITFSQAKLVYADEVIPPDFTNSPIIELSHVWDKKGFYGNAWYEIKFPFDAVEQAPWSIYLPQVAMNAEAWLNGSKIGSGGSFTAPISRQWHSPLSFSVPSKLLEKSNTLHIRVKSYANQFGMLGKVYLGPEEVIRPLFQRNVFESNTLNAIGGALALFFAIILLPVWFKRKDSLYFWFSSACFMWSIASMNVFVHEIPISEHAWEIGMQVTLGWMPIALLFFVNRLESDRFPRLERIIFIVSLSFTFAMIVLPVEYLFPIAKIWHIFALLNGLLVVVTVARLWVKTRKTEYAVALVSFAIIILSALYDFAVQWNWAGLKGERFLLDYTILLVLMMIGYLMVSHFINSIDETEVLNQELESRVKKVQKRIESNYEKILLLETEQAASDERERIYRNIHDDLGGKLLSIVYKSNSTKMADLARSALNDLREIVSHEPAIKKILNDEIDIWLKECKTRCEESGKKCNVESINLIDKMKLSDEGMKHLQRMLKEAVTNSIKHSKGDKINITLQQQQNNLTVSVSDNGDYSNLQQWRHGTGMGSLHYRCKELEGEISWSGDQQGGGVSWVIPYI